MRLSRRNVVVGLGTIVAGGGAALGSGAFSSTEAQRELEVNIVTGANIADDFVDIILNDVAGTDTLGVGENGDDDATDLFPGTNEDGDTDLYDADYTPSENDVSLMENDVKIVFGPTDNELPPNSIVTYDNLITVVNDDGNASQAFDVTFEVVDADSPTDPEPDVEFEGESPHTANLGTGNTTADIGVSLNTSNDDTSTGTLKIRIEEDNS